MPISSLLESAQDVQSLLREHPDTDVLDATILDHLSEQTVISLDSLISLMPQYTWNQIFYSVDQLARRKKIVLRRHRFEYMLFSNHFVA
ncbi:MAG: hypothetical protein CAF43_002025 [Nitrospira sp. CG24C]|jgi:hypothetical protein|nr:MAG: hypothetical protein CAF43_002025 [Nitrospira sp. CG24C]TKB54837.1 MAG: hypothetical protein E8D50_03735 [Nitrospira sp.]